MENSLSGFIHLILSNSLQKIYWIGVVESTNSMSQEIGHVTLSHGMSPVITLSRDCATPFKYTVVSFKRHKDLPQISQWWKNNNLFFLELGPQTLLLVPENILSQNIFLQQFRVQTWKIYFYQQLRVLTWKIFFDPILQTKYILGGCDTENIFCVTLAIEICFSKSIDLQAKYIYNINILPDI